MDTDSVSDSELLGAYARARDEQAFSGFVRRHADLVYAAARRQLSGDHHRAEEATQRVFCEVAKMAGALSRHPALVAWLHQRTRWAASHLRQAEARRRARESAAALDPAMQNISGEDAPDWNRLAPLLDEAVGELREADRVALLSRHFERCSFAELARRLGVSEAAAQMRSARATERLRRALERRGIRTGSAALAAVLAAQAAPPAPAGLAGAVLRQVIASSAGAGVAAGGAGPFFLMQTLKISALIVGSAVVMGGYFWLRPKPSPAERPHLSKSTAGGATAALRRPDAAPVSVARRAPDAWMNDFRALFGLSKEELRKRLAAMGFRPTDAALERILRNSGDVDEFLGALLRQLALGHPDKLMTHAIQEGADVASLSVLWELVRNSWRETRLEGWVPDDALVALMQKTFADDKEFVAGLDNLTRPYGQARDFDPVKRGGELLALPPERRRDGIIRLALDWPPERAHEMIAWGKANLEGAERLEFFSRLGYVGYMSANPGLALELFESLGDPELRSASAPLVAATLVQHDQMDAALKILASLEGKPRLETSKFIAKHLALNDPDAAVAWTNSLEGEQFDAALIGVFEHLPSATMRGIVADYGKGELAPHQEMAVLWGLCRTTSWADTKTASEVLPEYYAARGYAPLAAPKAADWQGPHEQKVRALQFDVAARTVWSLAQKQDIPAAIAWTERMAWATPEDKLVAQAYALPEAVEIYQRHGVLGPIREWVDQQLADPAKRIELQARLAKGGKGG